MSDQLVRNLASETGVSGPWLGEFVHGMHDVADAPILSDASQLVVRAAAEAQHREAHAPRTARRRPRAGFVPVLRRGLVFNLAVGAVLVIGSAALAIGSVEAGFAPEFVEDIVVDLGERVGITVTPPDEDVAVDRSDRSELAPGQDGTLPTGINNPGLGGINNPGLDGITPPGLGGNPGLGDGDPSDTAPGQVDDGSPGNSGQAPGLDNDEEPGNTDQAPGQIGDPGNSGSPPDEDDAEDPTEESAPAEESTPPGSSGSAPVQSGGDSPGLGNENPGQGNEDPGSPVGGPGGSDDADVGNGNADVNSGRRNAAGKDRGTAP